MRETDYEERVFVGEAKCLSNHFHLDEYMKIGYEEMAEINLKIAELCFCVECEVQENIEQKIAESE